MNDKLDDAFGQIEDAIVSANGKNVVHYEDAPPTVDDPGVEGDTWFVGEFGRPTDVVQATNLVFNPSFEVAPTDITLSSGLASAVQSTDATGIIAGVRCIAVTGAASGIGTNTAQIAVYTSPGIVPGSYLGWGWSLRDASESGLTVSTGVNWYAEGGSFISSEYQPYRPVSTTLGRLTSSFLVPATAYRARMIFRLRAADGVSAAPANFRVLSDGWLSCAASSQADALASVATYFDGDTTDGATEDDPHYRWTGTPHASTSEKFLPAIEASGSDAWQIKEQYKFTGGVWVQVELNHQVISSMDVGKLVAGSAAIKEAVVQKLWAEVVVAKMVVADEFIGENAILTGAVTASKITASEELWAKIGEFVKIRAEQIEADAIDGMVITGPNIRTAASGARVQLDAGGLSVYDSLDDWQVRLTPDGSSFKGDLEAESLVANGAAEFKSTDNMLAQGAKLTLAAGVTDPTAPPIVQPYWDGLEFDYPVYGSQLPLRNVTGLAFDGTNYWTVKSSGNWGDYPNGVFGNAVRINATTGATTGFAVPFTNSNERFGVTCIGSELFWLYRSGFKAFVLVTDLNCVKLREWEYTDIGYSKTNPLKYKPGIGNDGTNVVIAQCDDGGSLRWRTYNKTTGAKLAEVTGEGNTSSDITGIHIGPADWGGGTFVTVMKASTGLHATFTTAGAYDTNRSWYAEDTKFNGIVFADGKFRTLNPSGVIREYADVNTGDGSGDWWAAYRWYNRASIYPQIRYWSRISWYSRFAWPRRAKIKIMGQPLPAGVPTIEPMLAKKSSFPVRADFRRVVPRVNRAGESVAWYNSLPTNWQTMEVPEDTNTFPEAESSVLQSASGTFRVQGDGSGKWGPLTFNTDGTMTGVAATGRATITPTAANTPTSATVTFPAGRFSTPPIPSVTNDSGGTSSVTGLGVTNVTATSMTIGITRTNTSPTPVWWTAVAG